MFDGAEEVSQHLYCCNMLVNNVIHLVKDIPVLAFIRDRVPKNMPKQDTIRNINWQVK
jgi:hypothetical protein